MFTTPPPHEARKGAVPTITVSTTTGLRIDGKPDRDETAFEEAAILALAEALGNGHAAIAFEAVHEFVEIDSGSYRAGTCPTAPLVYRYVWTFAAHSPIERTES